MAWVDQLILPIIFCIYLHLIVAIHNSSRSASESLLQTNSDLYTEIDTFRVAMFPFSTGEFKKAVGLIRFPSHDVASRFGQ